MADGVLMTDDTASVRPHFEGMLDLDEPLPDARDSDRDVPPPEYWNEDEPLIIDVEGRIHVRGGRYFSSRVVGRVRGETAEASMAALVDRFQELEDRFKVLEREVRGSHNLVRSLKAARSYAHWVEDADAIGDFENLLDRAYAIIDRLEKKIGSSRSIKHDLVDRAEELADSTSWKATGEIMHELMDEWKKAGTAGSAEDDALWERFNGARKQFFERRKEHHAELRRVRSAGRKAKEDLIARATELATSTDWDIYLRRHAGPHGRVEAGRLGRPQPKTRSCGRSSERRVIRFSRHARHILRLSVGNGSAGRLDATTAVDHRAVAEIAAGLHPSTVPPAPVSGRAVPYVPPLPTSLVR